MAECMQPMAVMTSIYEFRPHRHHHRMPMLFEDMNNFFEKHCSEISSVVSTLSRIPEDVSTEIDRIHMSSWKTRHTRFWSNDDLLDFIYTLAIENRGIAVERLPGENFQDLCGEKLYGMTCQDFIKRDPMYGKLIYERLQERMSQDSPLPYENYLSCDFSTTVVQHVEPQMNLVCNNAENRQPLLEQPPLEGPQMTFVSQNNLLPKPVEDCISRDTDDDVTSHDPPSLSAYDRPYGVGGFDHDIVDVPFATSIVPPQSTASTATDCMMASTTHHHVLQPVMHQPHPWSSSLDSTPPYASALHGSASVPTYMDISESSYCGRRHSETDFVAQHHHPCAESSNSRMVAAPSETKPVLQQKRQYVRRRCSSAEQNTENDDFLSHRRRPRIPSRRSSNCNARGSSPNVTAAAAASSGTRSQSGKGGHLWEFIRHLLKTSEDPSNGSAGTACGEKIIQWEDRTEGVFRIVNSKAVAKLWGEQKDNRKKKMTYEKLSRALRWCRTDGFLSNVPKDGRFPKKLCFKFGPKATNWND